MSTPALAAAVARAGGLGMIGAAGLKTTHLADQLATALRDGGSNPRIGVNFLVPFLDPAALEVAASLSALVECFYGAPDRRLVERIHDGGALAAWQVGSAGEAAAAEAVGCDVIVVQGVEAGGHVRGTTPLAPLLAAVRSLTDLPLVAAGGLATGRAIGAVLADGADAARIGTRLVATHEANAHPTYQRALVDAGWSDTDLTETFSMGWPDAPHRVLRSCIEASDTGPELRSPLPPTRDFNGTVHQAALYAGMSVVDIDAIESAETLVSRLAVDAEATLR